MSKKELKNIGCCELISEMKEIVEELSTRPLDEFDLIDLHRLIIILEKNAKIINRLFRKVPHHCELCNS
ncbi:MAG TPA: hypothetical protein ENG66_00070 [Thermococcus sp.]|nr:hypothetical protein [Thermococcus sp.]